MSIFKVNEMFGFVFSFFFRYSRDAAARQRVNLLMGFTPAASRGRVVITRR